MKAIRIKEYGGPEVCKLQTNVPIPEPNDDQVQIKVHAAGINPLDTYIRTGAYPIKTPVPYTPGNDAAGIVTKVGKNVQKFKVGDRVYTILTVTGSSAEYTVASLNQTFSLPDNLSFEEGSALGVPYFTAYRSLFQKAHAQAGETALIHGASGSVGSAALQLAKANGLKVLGTAGTPDGLKQLREQGADSVYNHREPDYVQQIQKEYPNGVDVILEMLANVNLNNDLQLLKREGRCVVIGSRGNAEITPRLLMHKECTLTGVVLMNTSQADIDSIDSGLQVLMRNNSIKPVLGRIYKLEDLSQAHHDIMNNSGTTGRLTVKIL